MGLWRHSAALASALVGAPLGLAALALRPRWRHGLVERLGVGTRLAPGAVWVHGSSVGEILAALRLVDQLEAKGLRVAISTSTSAARQVVGDARPGLSCRLAPLDHPWAVDAALSRVSPRALVLVETELWPVWIAAARRRDVPVVLVSARVSDRSFPRYRRLGRLVSEALASMAAIGARTAGDAERLVQLGADPSRVVTTGDLKLEHDGARPELAPDLERALGDLPLVVAGSTHKGEEKAVLAALRAVEHAGLRARLVIAPRQLERTSEVRRLVRASGRKVRRRSKLGDRPLPGRRGAGARHAGRAALPVPARPGGLRGGKPGQRRRTQRARAGAGGVSGGLRPTHRQRASRGGDPRGLRWRAGRSRTRTSWGAPSACCCAIRRRAAPGARRPCARWRTTRAAPRALRRSWWAPSRVVSAGGLAHAARRVVVAADRPGTAGARSLGVCRGCFAASPHL